MRPSDSCWQTGHRRTEVSCMVGKARVGRRRESTQEALGAGRRVGEKLLRLPEPETRVASRLRLRYQHVLGKRDQLRVPPGPPPVRLALHVAEEGVPIGVAVIVERQA